VIPRMTLDIAPRDIISGLISCVSPKAPRYDQVERLWCGEQGFAHISVRSTLDAYLATRGWPQGSEVLISAVTIPHMAEIIQAWGLIPVPVDLDLDSMSPLIEQLTARSSARTRAFLVAHLFGGFIDLDPIAELCSARGWALIEDCAQSYDGSGYRGHPQADLSLFSFGSIKSATALGGALSTLRSPQLKAEMCAYRDLLPQQPQARYALKLLKSLLLKLLSQPKIYGRAWSLAVRLGLDFDQMLNQSVRGFSGGDLLSQIRQRPSRALIQMLTRRISQAHPARYQRRGEMVRVLCDNLPEQVWALGRQARAHSGWIIPVRVQDPTALTAHLRAKGYDVTHKSSSMSAIQPTAGFQEAARANEVFRDILYLPIYPPLGVEGYGELSALIRRYYDDQREEERERHA